MKKKKSVPVEYETKDGFHGIQEGGGYFEFRGEPGKPHVHHRRRIEVKVFDALTGKVLHRSEHSQSYRAELRFNEEVHDCKQNGRAIIAVMGIIEAPAIFAHLHGAGGQHEHWDREY